jgi:predicted PurR-regulated permease PerM
MQPTPFQKKLFWTALSMVAAYVIGYVLFEVGGLIIQTISFLQPLLIPVAISAIMAFLLEPVVQFLMRLRLSRLLSIVIVYLAVISLFAGIIIWILPAAIRQGNSFVTNFPTYLNKAESLTLSGMDKLHSLSENPLFKSPADPSENRGQFIEFAAKSISEAGTWLQQKVPDLALETGKFLQRSVGGFLGVFGFLLSMILVPIFLFFFLKESASITQNWSQYLPLRASPLKVEIVSLVGEINSYLVSFFRGQLIVSMIDGVLIASALLVMGLDFAVLIGLLVGILGLIPYLGMMITWIPAVIIAATQFQDWSHPIWVTVIFIVANNIDGMIIAPKIVGDSVGLHPLTVIASVLAWSLVLGGLLGALLAVPLTATLKVLLKRYFWDKPVSPDPPAANASSSA